MRRIVGIRSSAVQIYFVRIRLVFKNNKIEIINEINYCNLLNHKTSYL